MNLIHMNDEYKRLKRVKLVAYATYQKLTIKLVQWQNIQDGQPAHNPRWNYYIIVPLREINLTLVEQLAKCHTDEGVQYYDESFVFNQVFWHGGITYAEYHHKTWRGKNMSTYEVGCDYNHLADRGCSYDLTSVLNEALITAKEINDLIK